MTGAELRVVLAGHPETKMHGMPPDGAFVPDHHLITEAGRLQREFIDCGGTVRSLASCLLQIWVGDDKDHRLHTAQDSECAERGATRRNTGHT